MASVGQGGYLTPMAAFAAAQMQHMATINGLPGAPLTPTSGKTRTAARLTGRESAASQRPQQAESDRKRWMERNKAARAN